MTSFSIVFRLKINCRLSVPLVKILQASMSCLVTSNFDGDLITETEQVSIDTSFPNYKSMELSLDVQ